MSEKQEASEVRERLEQQELKKNPAANLADAFNRGEAGNLVNSVGSSRWKGTKIVLLVLVVGYIIVAVWTR